MFKTEWFKRVLVSVALILVGMLLAWVLTGSVGPWLNLTGSQEAQAAPGLPSTAAQRPPADPNAPTDEWYTCTSVGVAAYAARIHVQCSNPAPDGIYYFALSTADSHNAARTLSVLSMAHVTGKPLEILYDPTDLSGAAFGCQTDDCRLILSAIIKP
jgi:hypothetical protein